jgi:protein TonB
MNFDTYLETHRPNPKRAALLSFAAALALTGTTALLAAGWIAGKFSVARVDPPTVEYVLLSLTLDEPAPPPPPPPPPGSTEAEDEPVDEVDDDIIEPEDIEEQPDEVPTAIPKNKAKPAGDPAGQIGGIPGGQRGGIPGGNLTGLVGTKGPAISTKPPTQAPVAKKPLSAVMAQARYAPEPSAKELAMTKAARFDKRNGKNVTSFCIDTRGKVVDVKTKTRFPGDPQVDAIIRKTVSKWLFKPFEVGNKKVKTCTERTFVIKFQ